MPSMNIVKPNWIKICFGFCFLGRISSRIHAAPFCGVNLYFNPLPPCKTTYYAYYTMRLCQFHVKNESHRLT